MEKTWVLFLSAALVVAILLVVGVRSIMAAFLPAASFSEFWGFLLTALIWLTVLAATIVKGWTPVPHNHEYIVEYLGKYIGAPLCAGLHILFPWFGFVKIKPKQFLGVQTLPLYLDEQKKEDYGGGSVEFKDSSASLTAFVYFRVVNSALATYSVDDLRHAVEELTDHILRSFFSAYTIDQAIELKAKIGIREVACLVDFVKEPERVITDVEFYNSHYFKTLYSWGVEPTNLAVSDIILPSNILEGREKLFTAEQDRQAAEKQKETALINAKKDLEVAEINKQKAIVDAQALNESSELIGEGEGKRILKIAKVSSLSVSEAAQYFMVINKWEKLGAMKDNPNFSMIEGDHNGAASMGAAIGAGMKVGTEKEVEKEK